MRLIDEAKVINEVERFKGYLDDDMIMRIKIAINKLSTIDAEPNVETEEKTTYAWIMNKDIDGYVKTWWIEKGVIGVTFRSGNTYITGANNVLIKETKG